MGCMTSTSNLYTIDPDNNYYPKVQEINKKYATDTIWTFFERETKANPDKPSVAIREYDEKSSTYLPYKIISNTEVYNLATKLGAGFNKLGLNPLDNVLVALKGERWEVTVIRASIYRQAGNYVPITEDIIFFEKYNKEIIQLTLPKIIITEAIKLIPLLEVIKDIKTETKEISIKSIIVLPNVIGPDQKKDPITEEMKNLSKELNIELFHYEDIIKMGEDNPCEPSPQQNPENPGAILLSSGTSNKIKLVILSHKSILKSYIYIETFTGAQLKNISDKSISIAILLPSFFGHISDLSAGCSCLLGKGQFYNVYLSNGMKNAGQDLCMAKLRILFNSSGFYINIYNMAQAKIKSGVPEVGVIDFIKNKVLGGCMEVFVNTSSYLPTYIMKWYYDKLGIKMCSHYCLTECPYVVLDFPDFGGSTPIPEFFIGYRPKCAMVKIKKVDNKDIKFEEKVNGVDIITGELLVKDEAILTGIYKNSELTNKKIDNEGYFHTEDLVSWNTKDEILILKSRLDTLVNIGSGLLYPVSAVENEFLDVPFFKNVVVYCDKSDSNIFCITNINTSILAEFKQLNEEIKGKLKQFAQLNINEKKELLKNPEIKKIVNEQMNNVYQLKGFKDIIKFNEIILNPYECSTENGMLTRNGKIIREVIINNFMNEINEFRSKKEK